MRLLVIEDYPPLQQSLTKGLHAADFAVDATRDGKEGLWYATTNEYDVIILDLRLPGMDALITNSGARMVIYWQDLLCWEWTSSFVRKIR